MIGVSVSRSDIPNTSNETSEESSELDSELEPIFVPVPYICVNYVLLGLCTITLSYGILSWCLIKKFRNFKNYVFLSGTLVNVIRLSLLAATVMHRDLNTLKFAFSKLIFMSNLSLIYFSTVYNNWMVVMCYMLYVDIVKVFKKDFKKKYVQVTLLTWDTEFNG
ncbi:hypothetical protein HF086_016496 [Spodoptera exigua]|uniref:Uncharacterized protein n=1 Tax=Spodoptera exigua TaxID=7107 RepID=A0A922MW96_SPOEX|nr:hypothetical protein HF086_016496 [Spodoptera exigua]